MALFFVSPRTFFHSFSMKAQFFPKKGKENQVEKFRSWSIGDNSFVALSSIF